MFPTDRGLFFCASFLLFALMQKVEQKDQEQANGSARLFASAHPQTPLKGGLRSFPNVSASFR
jgi:hypothetical protein